MALSESEQKLLAQLESTLMADDPQLAQRLAKAPGRRLHPRRATVGVVGFLLGIVLLIVGMSYHWAISVVGFVAMLAAAIYFMTAWRPLPKPSAGPAARSPRPTGPDPGDLMTRLEQRWRDRQQGG
ncbi:MAG: DUF3040 domain-containing protein [Propionibacteriaceae bacterium]|jgi:protein-S-isoprenylcysteine O-methyltransferase Ste14|nr:DUF3040 domain-containing protein [Propionibacteriaceae bacterium]